MKLATASRRATRRAAFTLLEVLVVVAILVILAGVGVVATTRYLEDARKSKAQLGCKGIQQALDAYKLQNNGDYPPQGSEIQELLHPSNGGTPYLQNGQSDTIDPWGKQYQISYTGSQTDQTGTQMSPYVSTTASDGTPISQYGIGQKAQPPQ